ncbi:uncharacterized protein LOC144545007 [Carex rostrata]
MALLALLSLSLVLFSFSPKNITLTQAQCLPDQCQALIQLKQGFKTTELIDSWNASIDCYKWFGITCDEKTGMVTELNLGYFHISGEINLALFNLSSLRYLDLSFNNFFVPLPQTGFERLTNLTHLDLSSSGFSGEVLPSITNLRRLNYLDLGLNRLTGMVPMSLFTHPSFKSLYLSDNQFSVYLPYLVNLKTMMGISNTSFLTARYGLNYYKGLNLTYSKLFVTITYNGLNFELKYPIDIFNYIDLSNNVFLGEIPKEIGQLKSLCVLNLAHNALTSQIPSELASLHQLESLDLSSNQFSGPIPHELASLTSLDSLNLSYNALAGRIPSELASLHQLESLDLSSNQLSGPIPHELASLTSLHSLNLSYNALASRIPSELASLHQLELLDLSSNQLSGPIPHELTSLTSLNSFNLSYNNLVGEVPEGYEFSTFFSNDSYLGNPELCGSPLSMQCARAPSNIGFIVSIGVGLYLGFATVIWALVYWEKGRKWFILITDKFYFRYFKSLCTVLLHIWILNIFQSNIAQNYLPFTSSPAMALLALLSLSLVLFFFPKNINLTQAQCLPDQRHALIQLKQGFNTNELYSWNASIDCCIWDGITCDEKTGMVTSLNLFHMDISGEINPALFNLSSLRYLNISFNDFSVPLLQTGFERLANLTHLDLSVSGFYGQVPIGISALTNLLSLDLSNPWYLHNKGLRTLLTNLTKLQVLRLDGVDLSLNGSEWGKAVFQVGPTIQVLTIADCGLRGNFPDEIFHITNLTKLDLSQNSMLSGQLPEFKKQSFLQYLSLSGTNFTGPLPDSIGNLKYLSELDLSDCNFYEEVPPSITNLRRLNYLDLGLNRLTGEIPKEIGQLKSLCVLNLAHNALAGKIPSELASLHQLESLDLSSNQLSGPIPHELASLTSLDSLNLSYNALVGRIPSELASLHQLKSLDLSSNQLSGPIPHELDSLISLDSVNLSYNNLVGEVPEGPEFSAISNDSYLGNPGLCGSPLSMQCARLCGNPLSMQCARAPSNIGFIVSIGVGLYLGFATVIWALVYWENGRKWFILITDKFYFRHFH